MNTKINELIEIALIDGVLTEKQRSIIIRKAKALGEDEDEVEMILEAKLYEKQKSMEQEKPQTKEEAPKYEKFGDVKKCPSCGSMLQSFHIKCLDCGHEFSNIQSNESVNKLFEMLNDAENQRKDEGVGKAIITFYTKLIGWNTPIDSKKKTIISNFPIPTTKGDMLEFLSLSVPKARSIGNFLTANSPENKGHNQFVNVWKTKCEQIIIKARFSMKEDEKTLKEIEYYAKQLEIK
jgi:hypothetical protein